MSASLKEDRPKKPIVKPSRYQTTCSDDASPQKRTKSGGGNMTKTITSDIMELRGILQENSSHIYNNNNNSQTQYTYQTYKAQPQISEQIQSHTSTQAQYQPHTSTQAHYQSEQICNQYPSSQTPINEEPCSTLSYSMTPFTEPITTYSSKITSNRNNVVDNNINACNKYQVYSSRTGEFESMQSQITASCSAVQVENQTESRKTQEQFDCIEAELKRLNNNMERILKCVQIKQNRRRAQKPGCLPISTHQEMQTFETADEDIYEEVVDYLQYVGGFTVKEAINLSFKEVIKDSLTMTYTWFGREQGLLPLYKTRIIMAIYDAVCNNRHFHKPTRTEFQAYVREVLRSAKQRCRISTRVRRDKEQRARTARDYWKNNEQEEEENDVQNMDSHDEDN